MSSRIKIKPHIHHICNYFVFSSFIFSSLSNSFVRDITFCVSWRQVPGETKPTTPSTVVGRRNEPRSLSVAMARSAAHLRHTIIYADGPSGLELGTLCLRWRAPRPGSIGQPGVHAEFFHAVCHGGPRPEGRGCSPSPEASNGVRAPSGTAQRGTKETGNCARQKKLPARSFENIERYSKNWYFN